MPFPNAELNPPFRITRASHIVLDVADLDKSLDFYTRVIGLLETRRDTGVAFLRGVEESAHHSLVLREAGSWPCCARLGFRLAGTDDLDAAETYFARRELRAERVEAPYQDGTLRVADSFGIPLEFVVSMPAQSRIQDQPHRQNGGAALRFDHVQVLVPDPRRASEFYLDLGFRISDWFTDAETDEEPLGVFMFRKNNPHDLVFLKRPGPVLHHFAYVVQDSAHLFRALDVAGAVGWAGALERGPARHGEGHALYVYFRDPDGHRVEIMSPPIQMGDAEDAPQRWHRGNRHSWEYPAPKSWLYEASPFAGVAIEGKGTLPGLRNLEDTLAARPLRVQE